MHGNHPCGLLERLDFGMSQRQSIICSPFLERKESRLWQGHNQDKGQLIESFRIPSVIRAERSPSYYIATPFSHLPLSQPQPFLKKKKKTTSPGPWKISSRNEAVNTCITRAPLSQCCLSIHNCRHKAFAYPLYILLGPMKVQYHRCIHALFWLQS